MTLHADARIRIAIAIPMSWSTTEPILLVCFSVVMSRFDRKPSIAEKPSSMLDKPATPTNPLATPFQSSFANLAMAKDKMRTATDIAIITLPSLPNSITPLGPITFWNNAIAPNRSINRPVIAARATPSFAESRRERANKEMVKMPIAFAMVIRV